MASPGSGWQTSAQRSETRASATFRPPVDIDEGHLDDLGRGEGGQRQGAEAATEVGTVPGQSRKPVDEKRAPRVDPVPTEDARLRPQAESLDEPGASTVQRRVERRERRGTEAGAEPMVASRLLLVSTTQRIQFGAEPGTAAILGRQNREGSSRRQGAQALCHRVASLQGSGRRQHHEAGERPVRLRLQHGRPRDQRRDLNGIGGDRDETVGRKAVDGLDRIVAQNTSLRRRRSAGPAPARPVSIVR